MFCCLVFIFDSTCLWINLRCVSIHRLKLKWPFRTNYCNFIIFPIKYLLDLIPNFFLLLPLLFLFSPSSSAALWFFLSSSLATEHALMFLLFLAMCYLILYTPPLHLWPHNLHFNLSKSFVLINCSNSQPTSFSCVTTSLHLYLL